MTNPDSITEQLDAIQALGTVILSGIRMDANDVLGNVSEYDHIEVWDEAAQDYVPDYNFIPEAQERLFKGIRDMETLLRRLR